MHPAMDCRVGVDDEVGYATELVSAFPTPLNALPMELERLFMLATAPRPTKAATNAYSMRS